MQVREAQKLKRAYLEERRRRKEEAELEQCQPAPMTKKSRELAQKVAARRGSFFEREAKFSADRARKLERMKRHKVRTTTGATTSIISLSSRPRTDWISTRCSAGFALTLCWCVDFAGGGGGRGSAAS